MPIPYQPDEADSQSIGMTFKKTGVKVERWIGYDFASDFLTPSDSFSFQLGTDENGLPDELRASLKLGAEIQLHTESNILATGRIDDIEVGADRGGGTIYTIHGRDKLGQTLDSVSDPTFQLKNGGSLGELLKQQFKPFGWANDEQFQLDNLTNRDARVGKRGAKVRRSTTGGGRSKKRKKKSRGGGSKRLADFILHQTKPYNHESVFHFCSRVAQRNGLWIWCSADGQSIVVGEPDYDQEPIFALHRGRDGRGNIESGTVRYNLSEQPSILIADSFSPGGGGEYGKGRNRAYIINPMLGLTDEGDPTPEVLAILAKEKGAVEVTMPIASFPFRTDNIPFRPMYLHDDESKTQEQLNAFVMREMSLHYRKALTAQYTVEGHGQQTGDGFVAWAPDTVVVVDDEIAELRETLYVLGVAFHKSRSGGTNTKLDLVRLHTMPFGEFED